MDAVYSQSLSAAENRQIWQEKELSFNTMILAALNEQRAALDLFQGNRIKRE